MMELNRRDALIGVGVAVGAAALVLFMKKPSNSSSNTTDSNSIPGGFATADTVYVPTTAYSLTYDTYKGNVSYTTTTNNSNSATTTTISNSPGATANQPSTGVFTGKPIIAPPIGLPDAPVHTTTSPGKTNPPTKQTGTKPTAPAPKAPAPAHKQTSMGNMHYATPTGGWNPGSVVDYIKQHGGDSSFSARSKDAAAMGIKGYKGTAAQNTTLLQKLKQKYGA